MKEMEFDILDLEQAIQAIRVFGTNALIWKEDNDVSYSKHLAAHVLCDLSEKINKENNKLLLLLEECLDKMYKHSPSCTLSTIPECICEIGKLRTKIENELKGGNL